MEIKIRNQKIVVNLEILKGLRPQFSLWNGRRFSFETEDGKKCHDVSLNELIVACNKEFQTGGISKESLAFKKAFKKLANIGYSDGLIDKQNIFIRLITKIKHFFSHLRRQSLLKQIDIKEETLKKDPVKVEQVYKKEEAGKEKPIKEIERVDCKEETLNEELVELNFEQLPNEMRIHVLKFLCPLDLMKLSQTSKKNLKFVKAHHPYKKLIADMQAQALVDWKKSLASSDVHCSALPALMQIFPKEAKEALEQIAEKKQEFSSLLNELEKVAEKNPEWALGLLKKVEKRISACHFKDQFFKECALTELGNAYSVLNPEKSLSIRDQISDKGLKERILSHAVGRYFLHDPNQAFALTKNLSSGTGVALSYMIDSCCHYDEKEMCSLFDQICKFMKDENILKTHEEKEELKRRYEQMIDILVEKKLIDKALSYIDNHALIINSLPYQQNAFILEKYMNVLRKCLSSIPKDKLAQVIEKILSLCNEKSTPKKYSDEILYLVAKAYLKLNDLDKSQEFGDKIENSHYKIKYFLTLAEMHRNKDKDLSMILLDEAFLLVDQTKEKAWYTELDDLINIALHYAFFDVSKAKKLLKTAEDWARKISKDQIADTFKCSIIVRTMSKLAKAYAYIDPDKAFDIIKKEFQNPKFYQVENGNILKIVTSYNLLLKISNFLIRNYK